MNVCKLIVTVALLVAATLPAQIDPDGPAISPFRGMRQVDGGIEVQVTDDTWYALEAVAGVDTKTLLKDAKRLCRRGNDWKRITEDLPALLDAMGVEVGRKTDVVVRDLQTGQKRTFEGVEMTHENRRRVKEAQRAGRMGAVPVVANLRRGQLRAAQAREDLQVLRRLLETRFAYLELRAVDLDALLAEAAEGLDDGLSAEAFAERVDAVLRAFGDGHSRLRGSVGRNARWLPFLIQQVDGGHVAFRADRHGFVDDQRPFVVAIDGVPLARWLAAAGERVTKGSEVMQRGQTERLLRNLSQLRQALSLPDGDEVVVTLRGEGGEREHTLPVARRKPMFGAWPRRATAVLDGDVGYLRLERMAGDAEQLAAIDAAMHRFRDTRGLVIDVRGNGGGRREPLLQLAPYLLPVDGPPVVGNVAAVLLEDGAPAPPDALADRFLYRADWSGWSDRQRGAIGAFLRGFEPSWKLPKGRFSPWHFLVLDRATNPGAYHYDRPVVVLIDRGCFSATDIFVGALQALDGVTVVGEASAGGSGRARGYVLPNSGLRLQLSTMASFRPDGTLFEGHGVAPDVEVATVATDLIGATDTALARALELLR